jgi:hypothetical protein
MSDTLHVSVLCVAQKETLLLRGARHGQGAVVALAIQRGADTKTLTVRSPQKQPKLTNKHIQDNRKALLQGRLLDD